jgi:mono/diheme cytochrome c family protein
MFGWSQAGIHLPDSAIAHLIIYMRSASRVAPRQIYPGATRGRPERGRELYRELCGNCHGINGEGSRAPALNNQEFLNAATNGFLLATITLGRPGTAMPAWSHPEPDRRALSQDERLDLAAFARIWQKQTIDREWVTLSGTASSPRGTPSDTNRNVSP